MNYQQQQQQQNHQRRRFIPPQVGSIHRAKVTRLESYGCFVKFTPTSSSSSQQCIPISGLVHISQLIPLSSNNGNKLTVEDVVSLNDNVYIKVMDVTLEPPTEDGRPQRHKVKLSMKYVHQDTGQDLDVDGTLMEEDLIRQRQRSNNNNHDRNGGDANLEGTGGANSLLGRALATNIGMSSAIDPGTLILKGRRGGSNTGTGGGGVQFNGYSLVGEEEGEDTTTTAAAPAKSVRDEGTQNNLVRPMGRGRATTLPAWMTRQDGASNDDKLGSMKGEDGPGKDSHDNNKDSDSSRRGDRHRKKSSRRDKQHKERKHHKRHHRSSSRKHGRKHKKSNKRRKHRSQSRGRSSSASYYYSSSSDDDHDDYSRSRSRSPSYRRKKSKSKHHRRRHRRERDDYSRSRSRSRSRSASRDNDGNRRQHCRSSSPAAAFSNVEEARAIMERLERRRHRED